MRSTLRVLEPWLLINRHYTHIPPAGEVKSMTEKTDFDFFAEIVREMKNKTAVDDKKLIHLLGLLGCTLIDVKNMDELEALRGKITELRHEMASD